MLGARCEHPVRLEASASGQIVDEDADVRFVPPERERRCRIKRGIDSGDQALRGRLLVSRGAVDLSREEESTQPFRLRASRRARSAG